MTVTQPDSRTVRVRAEGTAFRIPYRFFWNGHDREPESIVLEEGRGAYEVRAFFLFATIKDTIAADATGISISRTWSLMTPGAVRLSIDLEFDPPSDFSCHFPAAGEIRGWPAEPVSFLGEKTSFPSAVSLFLGKRAVLVYARSSRLGEEEASVGVRRRDREGEEPSLAVEVRVPGIEEPAARVGPKPAHVRRQAPGSLNPPAAWSDPMRSIWYSPAGKRFMPEEPRRH